MIFVFKKFVSQINVQWLGAVRHEISCSFSDLPNKLYSMSAALPQKEKKENKTKRIQYKNKTRKKETRQKGKQQ